MAPIPPTNPRARDRALRMVRGAAWSVGVGAAGLTALFSVVAAHAFKGHSGKTKAVAAVRPARQLQRVSVPPPQHVPAISGAPALAPPAQPPAAAPSQQSAPAPQPAPVPQPAPAPQVSGGS